MQTHTRVVIASLLSLTAVAAAVAHAFFPDVKIDNVTAFLLLIAVAPWLGVFFKSLELPGGIKIEYHDLKAVEAKARNVGLISENEVLPSPEEQSLYQRIALEDPNLALAALRIEIEKELVALGQRHNYSARRRLPIPVIAQELTNAKVLPEGATSVLADLLPLLNRAVHGASVDHESLRWALTTGAEILASLRRR